MKDRRKTFSGRLLWISVAVPGATICSMLPAIAYAQQAGISSPGVAPEVACAKLLDTDFSMTEDAPAQITGARAIKGTGATPDHCEVEGYVWRNVKFRMQFPLVGWNGKMVVVGMGGQAGTIAPDDNYGTGMSRNLLPRGYAFIAHDSGHFSSLDAKWGYNNEPAMIDYGFRGAHVTTVIGKDVLARFFGYRPKRAYYHSCSNGGREAMMMSQRYPWDFDGIAAGSPSMAYGDLFVHLYWFTQLMKDRSRNGMDATAATILHKFVLAQCDTLDGRADGILDDPRKCKVDLARVACREGAAENCLTERQVEIARLIYQGPRRKDGTQIAFSSAMPGSELTWEETAAPLLQYPPDVFRYLAFSPAPGPGWQPDAEKLGDYSKRMGLMDALFSANNPDLRRFKKNGGKLLVYYGWTDAVGGARESMDYYDSVERLMGGQSNTQDFYRLFMIPGMNHCAGGEGATNFDFIGVIDKWVETGEAPDVLTGFHPGADGSPTFTRSIKPYQSGN